MRCKPGQDFLPYDRPIAVSKIGSTSQWLIGDWGERKVYRRKIYGHSYIWPRILFNAFSCKHILLMSFASILDLPRPCFSIIHSYCTFVLLGVSTQPGQVQTYP